MVYIYIILFFKYMCAHVVVGHLSYSIYIYIWVENISADSKIGQKKNFSNLEA